MPQHDREMIRELQSLLAFVHGDKGQHSVMVGLTQSIRDARQKLDTGVEVPASASQQLKECNCPSCRANRKQSL